MTYYTGRKNWFCLILYTFYVSASSVYEIDPCAAQSEILKKGPIVTAFAVFEDFLTYKSGKLSQFCQGVCNQVDHWAQFVSGVYQHVSGKLVGYHAARVVGWGIEKDTPYWLVVNSWNKSWGDNGTFKVLRGSDEIKFEEYFSAGDA